MENTNRKIVTCGELLEIHDVLEDITKSNIKFNLIDALVINDGKKEIDEKVEEFLKKMGEVLPNVVEFGSHGLTNEEAEIYQAMLNTETEIPDIDLSLGQISLNDAYQLSPSTIGYFISKT